MHPLYILAFATFIVFAGYLYWNKVSVDRHRAPGKSEGIGGVADPLSGDTPGIRDADELRGSLDAPTGPDRQRETAERDKAFFGTR